MRLIARVWNQVVLALDILPRHEAEDARQFAAARATLEAGKPPNEPERVMYMDKEKAQADAISSLRYLDTAAAVTYLASIFGQGRHTDRDIEYALYSFQARAAIVAELERRISDPDLTLTQSYLMVLSQLKRVSRKRPPAIRSPRSTGMRSTKPSTSRCLRRLPQNTASEGRHLPLPI